MSTQIEQAKSIVAGIGESLTAIRRAAVETQARIGNLEVEHTRILASPVTREDYIAMAHAEIDRKADAYKAKVVGNIKDQLDERRASAPYGLHAAHAKVSFLRAKAAGSADNGSLLGALRGADAAGDWDNRPLNQWAATFLLRDEMKGAIADAIHAVQPWPHADAPTFAASQKRLAAIEAELESLRAQLDALRNEAASAGIDLDASPIAGEDEGRQDDAQGIEGGRAPDDPNVPEYVCLIDGRKVFWHIDPKTGQRKQRLAS